MCVQTRRMHWEHSELGGELLGGIPVEREGWLEDGAPTERMDETKRAFRLKRER